MQPAASREPRHLKNSYASETPVTDGERVYVYFGNVGLFAFDMNGKPLWSQADGRRQDADRLGHRRVAGPPRGPRLSSSTTTTSSRSSPPSTRGPATESGASTATRSSNWATPFVWENDAADRDRHRRHRQGALLRSRRQAALGAHGHVVDRHPDAVRRRRAALRRLGLPGRPAAAGLRDPPGRVGRHLAQGRRDEQRVHRLVGPARSALQPVAARLRRLLLHAARPRLPDLPRREDRARRSTRGSGSRWTPPASPRRRGPTTARSSR